MKDAKLKFQGKSGTGVAGKAFQARNTALKTSAGVAPANASEQEREAAGFAKECGVVSSWAIFRDGAVYEFGTTSPMKELPEQLIESIGGSVGLGGAGKRVMAEIKKSKVADMFSKSDK